MYSLVKGVLEALDKDTRLESANLKMPLNARRGENDLAYLQVRRSLQSFQKLLVKEYSFPKGAKHQTIGYLGFLYWESYLWIGVDTI